MAICNNTAYLFVKKFPFSSSTSIENDARANEVYACLNPDEKERKFYVWQLLDQAVCELFDKPLSSFDVKKIDGKWVCDDFYFSLTHKNNVVAVAVSLLPVGVDIEEENPERFAKFKSEKMLCGNENDLYESTQDADKAKLINILWTKKESAFKMGDQKIFNAKNIDTTLVKSITHSVCTDTNKYFLSVVYDAENVVEKCFDGVEIR